MCDFEEYEKMLKNCKKKPTVASVIFESALLGGFSKNKTDITIYSFPMIPTFPESKYLCWMNKKQLLECGYQCVWLRTINVPFLKQISRKWDGERIIESWLDENKKEKCAILVYSIPPFLVRGILKYSKKYNVKCYAIVPDLLRNMYMNSNSCVIIDFLKQIYLKKALKLQGDFDGYIYLTAAMVNEVNKSKPYIVMEGIANSDLFNGLDDIKKSHPPAIMYAGRLHEKYGVLKLLDAFELANIPDAELWIFGDGSLENVVKQRALKNPKIRFWGRCPLGEVLEHEKKASLLVNPRSPKEEFTQFSFPSKTIEYMLSGTPLLTTKLPGIPLEYFDYVFSVDDNDEKLLAVAMKDILKKNTNQLQEFGLKAANFIRQEKNDKVQACKVLNFIAAEECINESS